MSKVIDFINNGELVRNPKYNPKTKRREEYLDIDELVIGGLDF